MASGKFFRYLLTLALLLATPAHASVPVWSVMADDAAMSHQHGDGAMQMSAASSDTGHCAPMSCCASGGHCCPAVQVSLPLLLGPSPDIYRESAAPPLVQPDLSRETEPPRYTPA